MESKIIDLKRVIQVVDDLQTAQLILEFLTEPRRNQEGVK